MLLSCSVRQCRISWDEVIQQYSWVKTHIFFCFSLLLFLAKHPLCQLERRNTPYLCMVIVVKLVIYHLEKPPLFQTAPQISPATQVEGPSMPDGKRAGLIKSTWPLFQLHFSAAFTLGKYFIFGKTLDKMLDLQYILKLKTCNASFRSSEKKQRHMCILKCVLRAILAPHITVYNAALQDKHSQTLPDHRFEWVSLHHQFCEFYSTGYSLFNREKYLALTSRRWVCGALLYIKISSKSSQRHNKASIRMATCNRALSSGWLSQHWMWLLWHPISVRMVGRWYWRGGYRACRLVWKQPWVRSITRCVTKLILKGRHCDQSLHTYPPNICMQGPRGNSVFEYTPVQE